MKRKSIRNRIKAKLGLVIPFPDIYHNIDNDDFPNLPRKLDLMASGFETRLTPYHCPADAVVATQLFDWRPLGSHKP